jgi:ParB family chromosome partitioning protein
MALSMDNKNASAAAVYLPVADLRLWPKNPRKNDGAVEQIAASIARFGFAAPVVVQKSTGFVLCGNTRLKAARHLGLAEVPARVLDLSDAEAEALAIADNRLGELADWDAEALAAILRDLDAQGAEVKGLGFTDDELAGILEAVNAVKEDEWGDALGALPEGDRAPIQSMTFTLHDEQAETVKRAMAAAKDMGEFVDTGNENSNGNALARVCEMFLSRCVDG